ncbi:hypothetical protein BC936DRAFT_136562, partial [Jimgerdemannia flammicorona]
REVPWHFANIISTSIRRTLIVGGFGSQKRGPTGEFLPLGSYDMEKKSVSTDSASHDDEEKAPESNTSENLPDASGDSNISIVKDKYPYFHYDVDEAVRAANRT